MAARKPLVVIGGVTQEIPSGDVVAAASGGTGLSTYAIGDLIYASGVLALSKLADVATGNALISGGVNTAPSWGKITSSHVDSSISTQSGFTWVARAAAEANAWQSVAYGNGVFVAVSAAGTNQVMTSPDGVTWAERSAASGSWAGVTFGNGLFVVVGGTGTNRVMTSPDGITWTARTEAEANSWAGIAFGNNLFVAVSAAGTNRVMTSPDGITWTSQSASENNFWQNVTYGNGLFVAVSSNGTNQVMTSPDGITWTSRSASAVSGWWAVTYGNGIFVAVSFNGLVMSSPDGETWTSRTIDANAWNSVTYGDGIFVTVASSGTNRVATSPDGINWTGRSASEANSWWDVAYGNGIFVSVSTNGTNRVMTSGVKQEHTLYQNNSIGFGPVVRQTSPTLITPGIDGGTIDNSVIGGTTPAAGTFTTGQFTGNLTVDGNLYVNGDVFDVFTASMAVEDPLIKLGVGNAADTVDIGLYGLYTSSGTKYAGLFRDATDSKWKLFTGLTVEPTTTVDTGGSGYTVGTLVANLEGNITGNAATVTTNANLTGPITSSGNSTTVASQTGTGSKFVMDDTPTLITPNIGAATATSLVCPTFTSAAAMGFTPAAGSGFNVTLSGAGDFAVNTNHLYVDTSTGNVGIGTTPSERLEVYGNVKLSNATITSGVLALRPTGWGYSQNTYRVVQVGAASGTETVSLGYDPSGNTEGSFTGDGREILFRNGIQFTTPNAANTGWHRYVLTLKDGNVGIAITAPTALCHLGASTTARASLCIPSGTAPTSPVTGDIWYDGTNLKFRDSGTTRTLTWV